MVTVIQRIASRIEPLDPWSEHNHRRQCPEPNRTSDDESERGHGNRYRCLTDLQTQIDKNLAITKLKAMEAIEKLVAMIDASFFV